MIHTPRFAGTGWGTFMSKRGQEEDSTTQKKRCPLTLASSLNLASRCVFLRMSLHLPQLIAVASCASHYLLPCLYPRLRLPRPRPCFPLPRVTSHALPLRIPLASPCLLTCLSLPLSLPLSMHALAGSGLTPSAPIRGIQVRALSLLSISYCPSSAPLSSSHLSF
jgi:hypothetical protein